MSEETLQENEENINDASDVDIFGESQTESSEQASEDNQAETRQDTQESQETEDWVIPGKFKSVEDTRKGFKETEQYLKKLESERKELRTLLEKIAPALQQGEQSKESNPESLKEQFFEAFEEDPVGVLAAIAEQIAESKVGDIKQDYAVRQLENIEAKVQSEFPNFDMRKNDEAITEELKKYDENFRTQYPEVALRIAVIDAMKKLQKLNQVKQEGKVEGEQAIRQKMLGSSTVSSQKSIPSSGSNIADEIFSFNSPKSVYT